MSWKNAYDQCQEALNRERNESKRLRAELAELREAAQEAMASLSRAGVRVNKVSGVIRAIQTLCAALARTDKGGE
jgi:hypothetical protein